MTVSNFFLAGFIDWSTSHGSKLNEFITIRKSNTGGVGVFFDVPGYTKKHGSISKGNHVELMRVPKNQTLSLDSFMTRMFLPQVEYDEGAEDGYLLQSQVMKRLFMEYSTRFQSISDPFVSGGLNETNLLVGEIEILVLLKKVRERLCESSIDEAYKQFLKNSPFAELDEYLELLYLTEVRVLKLDDHYESFQRVFKYTERVYKGSIEDVKKGSILDAVSLIRDSLGNLADDILDFVDDVYLMKIQMAVVSRILEIPEPIEKKGDEDGNESVTYGFAVSSTMVPLIDFVNHSVEKVNAVFDIDLMSNDVLLKLRDNVEDDSGEIELFIMYSEYDDILKFITAYGFLPRSSNKPAIYELAINREYLEKFEVEHIIGDQHYGHNLGLLLKYIGQAPNVQFVVYFDENGGIDDLELNLTENYMLFGFARGLRYDEEEAKRLIKQLYDIDSDVFAREMLELLESPSNDIIRLETSEIPYKSHESKEGLNITVTHIVESASESQLDQYTIELIKFLYKYSKSRLHEIKQELENIEKGEPKESLVTDIMQFERSLLNKFMKKVESYQSEKEYLDLLSEPSEFSEEWEKNRLRPRVTALEVRRDIVMKYDTDLLKDLEKLKIAKSLSE